MSAEPHRRRREVRQAAFDAAPVVAHAVAVLAVPLAPAERKAADLVAVVAQVPGLGDHLHALEHRVLRHRRQERAAVVEAACAVAGDRRRQVEAEAVDVHLLHPVAQAVHHQPQHRRVAGVERVAGAGEVEVVPVVLGQAVVAAVVDALEAERRAQVVAFAAVVVDHVQDHLDAGRVQRLHHVAEFVVDVAAAQVARLRREEADGVVAPVVGQAQVDQPALVVEGVHRQQLHRRHAQVLQVRDGRARCQPAKVPRVETLRRRVEPVQRGVSRVGAVEVAHQALHAAVLRVVEQVPVERASWFHSRAGRTRSP
jgi:hypothetical protein